ncbi:prepilin peptidase [Candidatus Woesearchaeota archaeon]|nr:prepilin peptidase [Candidatus Woesearchaeota archaeon]
MLEIEVILLILAFIVTIIAVISDIKTTEIPDYSNYFLIFSAILVRLIYSFSTNNWIFILEALKTFPVIFILSLLMYKLNQWGGGDVKLLFGLSIAFATYPLFLLKFFSPKLILLPFPLIIFLNVLIIGAAYSFTYAVILAVINMKNFSRKFISILKEKRKTQIKIFVAAVLLILISFRTDEKIIPISISIFLFIIFYVHVFIASVEKSCLIKTIPVSKLLEGDWILNDIFYNNKIIYRAKQQLTGQQIEKIKRAKIEKVLVKQGIVFSPAILIALIVSLIFGNLIYFLF